ncbi:unnamed protein product [Rhodiola kirilowii]
MKRIVMELDFPLAKFKRGCTSRKSSFTDKCDSSGS